MVLQGCQTPFDEKVKSCLKKAKLYDMALRAICPVGRTLFLCLHQVTMPPGIIVGSVYFTAKILATTHRLELLCR